MITDGQLYFRRDWVETTISVHISDDTIDCEIATPNFGVGTPLWVNIVVAETFVGVNSTEQFAVLDEVDDGSGAPDGASWAILMQSEIYLVGACVLGFPAFVIPLPAFHRRHLKVTWDIAVAVLTEGIVNAWISLDSAPDNS